MESPHGAPRGISVTAEDFGLKGPRGWAFRGVRIDAEPGALIAIEGPSGSGRTCLLLALTGRMRPTAGHAAVGRMRLPKQLAAVRRISALGPVPGVTDLDPALTVREQIHERALLQRRFGDSLRSLVRPPSERRAAVKRHVDDALAAAGLDLDSLPKGPRTSVRDLERLEALRLSVALALIGEPRLLGVDDVDMKLSDAERAEAWGLLRSVAESGTTVVAVCSEAPEGALVVSTAPVGDSRDETVATEVATEEEHRAEVATEEEHRAEADKDKDEDETKGAADALAETGRA
ncbi:ATP-binding cassette domain-containing protein [Streptomyces sp. LHD-70]|uniref:ATP-binding cassette domain-containing protein n=1 Tax=Streptomyces sp. LHD-70 TaxID=3072140 RepID=UPI00280D6EFC|nr:ATP-binding cassette domain-containing protein [Streptomyces sp. LHD-70]MDQ8701493.1 ATP-binding cassette domain-containing protein [Streptomyces sp. LHD-70]